MPHLQSIMMTTASFLAAALVLLPLPGHWQALEINTSPVKMYNDRLTHSSIKVHNDSGESYVIASTGTGRTRSATRNLLSPVLVPSASTTSLIPTYISTHNRSWRIHLDRLVQRPVEVFLSRSVCYFCFCLVRDCFLSPCLCMQMHSSNSSLSRHRH